MVDIKYERAYSEVLEILRYIPIEDYNKIPKEKIEIFKKYANTNCNFIYNPNKTLNENNVSKIAKAVIAILYRDYWATDEQRKKIISWQEYDRQRIEKEKIEMYDIDNIFNKKDTIKNYQKQDENVIEDNLPIEVKENNIFMEIVWYIKKILHIDS